MAHKTLFEAQLRCNSSRLDENRNTGDYPRSNSRYLPFLDIADSQSV